VNEVELFESVPNFSEGKDRVLIEAIAKASAPAYLLDVDADPDHHRVVVSVAGTRQRLLDGLLSAIAAAAERIDLRTHTGVHPRVGAADVVPVVPLGSTSLDTCREVARELGARVWKDLGVPVFFYGHGADWTLADVRAGRAQPDLGGPDLHPSAGAVCIGARHLLVAFNVELQGMSVPQSRSLARSLRESAAGMRGVQALVFELPRGRLQLSMNLFRVEETPPSAVIAELRRRGVSFANPQLVGLCPAVAADGSAGGRILEARIGAAVAGEGASRCMQAGDAERAAVGERLGREAKALGRLGAEQERLLAGAERCVALVKVMEAADVLDAELAAMAGVAARGLRQAIIPETAVRFQTRALALDRQLGASV
jgi:glutamate formiminotransferase